METITQKPLTLVPPPRLKLSQCARLRIVNPPLFCPNEPEN